MHRSECYNAIVDAFEKKYSWLGKAFAEEFLLTVASWNIQAFSEPEFRIRRHLLLFFEHGWGKSTLLKKASAILGDELCTIMSDVTLAALRGTVEHGQFITPYTLKRPFSICTEFGQIVGGSNTEIVQKLLNVLEEGVVTVSLAKIATLRQCDIDEIMEKHGIKFIDSNTFTYKTNWVLIAGTYNKKFLVDNAFESRFVILMPQGKLDSSLTRHINNSDPFVISEDVVDTLRKEVLSNKPVDCMVRLPDAVYNYPLTLRDSAQLLSTILCKKWWGIKSSNDEIIDAAREIKKRHDDVWKSSDDKVFDALEAGYNTMDDLINKTGLSKRAIYYSLKSLRARKVFKEGKAVWEII